MISVLTPMDSTTDTRESRSACHRLELGRRFGTTLYADHIDSRMMVRVAGRAGADRVAPGFW